MLLTKKFGSKQGMVGRVERRHSSECCVYGIGSRRGHIDNRKRAVSVAVQDRVMISRTCVRMRQRLPIAVSVRGTKKRYSSRKSSQNASCRESRNSTHVTSSGRRKADRYRKRSSAWVMGDRGSGPVHGKPWWLFRFGWKR